MEVWAVHPHLDLIAAATSVEIVLFSSLALRRVQRFTEAGCKRLAWHQEGPSLAAYVVRSCSASVLLFTNSGAAGPDSGLVLRCAHRIQLSDAEPGGSSFPAGPAGLAFAAGHLLLAGAELAVWGCSFTTGGVVGGAHFLHCAEDPQLRHPLASLGPVVLMELDGSQRFLATLHRSGACSSTSGDTLRVWSVFEGSAVPDSAACASGCDRRRSRLGRRSEALHGMPGHVQRSPVPCAGARQEVSSIDGVCNVVLQHARPVSGVHWCPMQDIEQPHCCPAVLAVVDVGGAVTVWRENATSEPLTFVAEAFWQAQDLWTGTTTQVPLPAPGGTMEATLRWAEPRRDVAVRQRADVGASSTEDDFPVLAGLPLRVHGHNSLVSAAGPGRASLGTAALSKAETAPSTLVVLRNDGFVAVLHLETRITKCPLNVRRVLLPVPVPVQGGLGGTDILHAAVVAGEIGDAALEVWLSLGSDMCRARLEQTESATVLAVTGGHACTSLAAAADSSEREVPSPRAEHLAVHRLLGLAACHVREPSTQASVVWIFDTPCGCASPSGDRYDVSTGAWRRGSHGSMHYEAGLESLCWAPGRVVPPVLLAIASGSRKLLSCVVDPVRGVIGKGNWNEILPSSGAASIGNVQQLHVLCDEDEERSMICLMCAEDEACSLFRVLLGYLEVPAGSGVPTLRVLYRHEPSLDAPSGCCAVEWLSCLGPFCGSRAQAGSSQGKELASHLIDVPKAGDLVGQLAVWSPAPAGSADICVHTLVVESARTTTADAGSPSSEWALGVSGLPFRASMALQNSSAAAGGAEARRVKALSLAVSGEWLVALTSLSQVLVWCLTPSHNTSTGSACMSAEFCNCFPVPTRLQTHGSGTSRSSRVASLRPYIDGPVSHSSLNRLGSSGAVRETGVELTRGDLSLHRFAGGGLGFLARGCSATHDALPMALICTRSASEGETWRSVNLRADALPIASEALSWMSDGHILHAGQATDKSSAPLSIIASKLPAEALGWLSFSTPCPSYHPETLVCLALCGQTKLSKSILASLLRTLQGPRAMGISPLLDLPFSEFLIGEEDKRSTQPSVSVVNKAAASDSAADLFGDGDISARFSRFDVGFSSSDTAADSSAGAASRRPTADSNEWRLPGTESEQLAELLQTTALPLVSAGEQMQLLGLLQDQDVVPRAADVDECALRYMQALALQTSVQRRTVMSSVPGEPPPLGQHLSSEDMCWALHSSCQSTIVDGILQTLGANLDWPALRAVGLGFWLTDSATVKKIVEALPRSIMKKQGKDDFQPESFALWYAMMGKRTLLGALYKQQKQMRICEFLANNLAEEPWRTKAKKNAFELVRQRRYELACAFFIFARNARDAIDVCVRYLDDWALALLVAQHLRGSGGAGGEEAELAAELRRLLSGSLLPLARRARDPWLASLAYWRMGEYGRALKCVIPPYRLHMMQAAISEGEGAEGEGAADEEELGSPTETLLSGGTVRYGGISPGLPRFVEVVRDVMAKRRLTADEDSLLQDAEAAAAYGGAMGVVSKAYLVRRQPLLALPQPSASSMLPWRIAVGVARATVSLFCAGGQPLVRHDGSVVLSELAAELTSRLSLPPAVIRAILSEVNSEILHQDCSVEPSSLFANVTPFYSLSFALPPLPSSDSGEVLALGAESMLLQMPPYLRSYMGDQSVWAGTLELKEELSFCRILRCLSFTHASRTLSMDERSIRIAVLSALVWRTMLRFRQYLQDSRNAPLPAPTMHLAAHLICALCVSRPPAPLSPVGAAPPAPSDLPGDLAHIVTALVVTLTMVLSLSSLTPASGLWALRSDSTDAEGEAASLKPGNRSSASEAFELFLKETEDTDFEQYATRDEEAVQQPEARAPPWEPTFWQGLRVLLEHLEGSTLEQRKLHRSGVLPSLIVSLFLRPAFIGEGSNTEALHGLMAGASEETSTTASMTGATSTASGSAASTPPRPSSQGSLHGSSESEDEIGTGAAQANPEEVLRQFVVQLARDAESSKRFKMFLQTALVELAVERLVALLSGIRKRQPGSSGHWIMAWYESLLSSLRAFLRSYISERVLRMAAAVSVGHEKLAVMLCAPEAALSEVFGDIGGGASSGNCSPRGAGAGASSGTANGAAFLALWRQLNGTRRLQILFSHHPALGFRSLQLQRRSAVLWRYGGGVPIRFVAGDLASPMRLAVHARGNTVELHAGHAARWFAARGREMNEAEATMHCFDGLDKSYVQAALATTAAAGPGAPEFDAAAEMLLGSSSSGRTAGAPPVFAGTEADVAHFFATLQHAGGRDGSFSVGGSAPAAMGLAPRPRSSLICAEAHPSRPLYAVACEDSSVHLWAFAEPGPRCALPSSWRGSAQQRPVEGDPRRRPTGAPSVANATAAAAAAAPSNDIAALAMLAPVPEPAETAATAQGREQRKCTLAWNNVGDRLLGVGSQTAVTLWTVGEGRGACQANAVPTGAAHARVTCGIFVSPGSVVATAGRRSDSDVATSRAWAHTAAGLCIWDTLAPPRSALVAHDGLADAAAHQMPADYVCLAWATEQRSILCGTKSGELRIFDLRQQRISQRMSVHEGSIRYCFVLPRTQRFVTLSAAAEMKVWSLRDFECLETRPRLHSLRGVGSVLGKTQALTCATLLSDCHLVTGGQDGVVLLTRL